MNLELNQNVVWWRGPSGGRLTAVHASVIDQRDNRVQISLVDGSKRWVNFERIQIIRSWYYSWLAPDHIDFESPLDKWGTCTIHKEIHQDLFPNRCVYEFQIGKYLRYDRLHWFDNYGSLGTLAFCQFRWKEFWSEANEISFEDFDQIWNRSGLPDKDIDKLEREMPIELASIRPWTRKPIQIGR